MHITRIYQNSDGATIRIDDIFISITGPKQVMNPRIGNDPGLQMVVGGQHIKTQNVFNSSGDRAVDEIQLVGDIDQVEPSSGSFAWATKTLGSGQVIFFDMSGLPVLGDTI